MRARSCSLAVTLLALAGCSGPPQVLAPREHEARHGLLGSLPEPGAAPREADRDVVVGRAPPTPPEEHPDYGRRPGDEYEWVPGYFSWSPSRSDFEWTPGGWIRPPRGRAWIAPRWVDLGENRWRFLPGLWQ